MAQDSVKRRIGGIDEHLLNAYIDGELDPAQSAEVALQLESDQVANSYVRQARRVASLAQAVLMQVDERELSTGLSASMEALHKQADSGPPATARRPLLAVAAGLAVLAIGYGAGFLSAEYNFNRQVLALEEARSQSLDEVKVALNRVLEYSPSGKPISWQSQNGRASAELLPIRTLKTDDQRFCREFQEVVIIDGVREERRGLSCRRGKEDWQTRLILMDATGGLL